MKSAHKIKTATIITTTTATSTRKQQEQQLTSGRAWAFDCRDRRKRVQMSNWAPKRTTKYLRGYKKSTTAVAVAARWQSSRLLSCGPSLSFSLSLSLSRSRSLSCADSANAATWYKPRCGCAASWALRIFRVLFAFYTLRSLNMAWGILSLCKYMMGGRRRRRKYVYC